MTARGGPAQALADAFAGRGGTWSRAGVIVFAPDIYGPLLKVSQNGGATTAVTQVDSGEVTHRNPYFLPDGRRFLFIERQSSTTAVGRLMVGSVDGAAPREVLNPASNVQLSAGYLLFVRDRSLLAQRFDAKTLSFRGPIVPVAENLAYWNAKDIGDFSATPGGLLVFRREAISEGSVGWFDRDGRLLESLGSKEEFQAGALSRDFRQLARVRREPNGQAFDIWVLDLATRQSRRVTFTSAPFELLSCAFSPDGQRLAVSQYDVGQRTAQASGPGPSSLWIQPVSGTRSQENPLADAGFFMVMDWSPDGKFLLGWSQRTGTSLDITFIQLDDPAQQVRDLVSTRFSESNAQFSPDGNWVVYQSNESGRNEVYVVNFPNANRKLQVSRDGGVDPVWSQDGREIVFRSSGWVMASPVTRLEGGIEIGTPARFGFSEGSIALLYGSTGKRLLAVENDPAAGRVPVEVVRNWSATLSGQDR